MSTQPSDMRSKPKRRNGKSKNAFRTISEVADELSLATHVLRFWETKFTQIQPMKRGGGRRYYRPEDVALLRRIRSLLYDEGYTIKGVQKLMRDGGVLPADDALSERAQADADAPALHGPALHGHDAPHDAPLRASLEEELRQTLSDLKAMRDLL